MNTTRDTAPRESDEESQLKKVRAELREVRAENERIKPMISSLRAENDFLRGQVAAYKQVIDAFLQRMNITTK